MMNDAEKDQLCKMAQDMLQELQANFQSSHGINFANDGQGFHPDTLHVAYEYRGYGKINPYVMMHNIRMMDYMKALEAKRRKKYAGRPAKRKSF